MTTTTEGENTMSELRTLTNHERTRLRAAHDFSVVLGAICPDDCVFRTVALTTAEDHSYAPPDSYAAGLKALREKEAR